MAEGAAPAGGEGKAGAMRYAAFISYSHADTEMCDRLHKRLESYAVPHSLVGRNGPLGKVGKRLGKFFRDRADLGAHHDLGAEIREALGQSAALIVLCSPKSAQSRYVEDEIRHFKSLGRGGQVFAAIISGEPHAAGKPGLSASDECFPRALIYRVGADGALTDQPEATEPIAADLRDKKDGLENGALKLIAGLLDIGLDDLVQREKQAEARRRRQAYAISAVMGVLAIGAGVGGMLAWVNGEKAAQRAVELQVTNDKLDASNTQLKATNTSLDLAKKDVEEKLFENQKLTTRITSVVDEITGIAINDPNVPDRLLFLASGAKLGMSAASLDMIFRFEFPDSAIPEGVEVVSGQGICVGVWYCLSRRKPDEVRATLARVLPPADAELLAGAAGLREDAARKVLGKLSTIKLTRKQSLRIFGESMLPDFLALTLQIYPKAIDLPPDCLGALASLTYNIGGGGQGSKPVRDAMADGKFDDVPAAFRAVGETYAMRFVDRPQIAARLKKRREIEAALFEQGLKTMAPAIGVAPR